MTKQQTVRIDAIDFAAGTQVREAINESVVSDYAERMTEGVKFPPVVLFHDGNHYYMADGFHRGLAAKRIGLLELPSEIHAGTKQDALWFALGANRENGQRLTDGDKQHAVRIALAAWPEKMQREIAKQVGCSPSLVSKVAGDAPKNSGVQPSIRGRALVAQKKREAIKEMVEAGAQSIDIKRQLKVSHDTIAEVRRELGRSSIDYSRAAVKERREQMRKMAADGYTSRQIADATGLSLEGCRDILKKEGIGVPADAAVKNTHRHDSTRILERIVQDAENLTSGAELIDYDEIDHSRLSGWITALETARTSLNAFIRQLVKEQQKHGEAA